MTIDLIVSEVRRGSVWEASWDGDVLCKTQTPLLASARELIRRGVSPDAAIAMRQKGSAIVAMTTTVGIAARLTIGSGPRFELYRADHDARSGPVPDEAAEDAA
jgi:hypothetical protein